MKSKENVIAWAVIHSSQKVLCLEHTREEARHMKRWYKKNGVNVSILKLAGKEIVR